VHPDTVTDRFNRLVDRAGVKRIRLHDVRHTYATVSLDSGVDPKIVSDRIRHANMAYTLTTYTYRSTGKDRGCGRERRRGATRGRMDVHRVRRGVHRHRARGRPVRGVHWRQRGGGRGGGPGLIPEPIVTVTWSKQTKRPSGFSPEGRLPFQRGSGGRIWTCDL
jgi:hypothetical protein